MIQSKIPTLQPFAHQGKVLEHTTSLLRDSHKRLQHDTYIISYLEVRIYKSWAVSPDAFVTLLGGQCYLF